MNIDLDTHIEPTTMFAMATGNTRYLVCMSIKLWTALYPIGIVAMVTLH